MKQEIEFTPVITKRASEAICEQITNMIISGKLNEGDRLPSERELMEKLQRSRPTIREALRMLERNGLIRTIPGSHGAVVAKPSPFFFEKPLENMVTLNQISNAELLEVRGIFEINTVKWAALRRTDSELETIKNQLDMMLANRDSEFSTFISLDIAFHQAIDTAAHNKLASMFDEVCHILTEKILLEMHSNKNDTEKEEMKSAERIYIEKIEENTEENNTKRSQKGKADIANSYLTMEDVFSGKCEVSDLAEQLSVEEMALLCVGTARGGQEESSTIGAASRTCPGAAGDTTSELLEKRGVRNIILADGPAGLRLSPRFIADKDGNIIEQAPALGTDFMNAFFHPEEKTIPEDAVTSYQYCTGIPTETLLAQTWDVDAVYKAGDIIGSEMEEFGITLWLAPGMNIHRNPLCGRNFEYYSEDPLVSGLCAAAETQGVQAHPGVGTTIKHFACNNLEDNRAYNNSHVTERALREIYLRGFEIAVKASQPMSIMSSYNMINGIHAANSEDLLTKVAREEWGFSGIVMTDWGTTAEAKPDLEGRLPLYGCSSAAACIKAGNDLIMPGSQDDVDEIVASVGAVNGSVTCPLTEEELRSCAARILNIIAKSNMYENNDGYADALHCTPMELV